MLLISMTTQIQHDNLNYLPSQISKYNLNTNSLCDKLKQVLAPMSNLKVTQLFSSLNFLITRSKLPTTT